MKALRYKQWTMWCHLDWCDGTQSNLHLSGQNQHGCVCVACQTLRQTVCCEDGLGPWPGPHWDTFGDEGAG